MQTILKGRVQTNVWNVCSFFEIIRHTPKPVLHVTCLLYNAASLSQKFKNYPGAKCNLSSEHKINMYATLITLLQYTKTAISVLYHFFCRINRFFKPEKNVNACKCPQGIQWDSPQGHSDELKHCIQTPTTSVDGTMADREGRCELNFHDQSS